MWKRFKDMITYKWEYERPAIIVWSIVIPLMIANFWVLLSD